MSNICEVYLILKAVTYKFYRNLLSLLVPTYLQKNLLRNCVTGLPISINCKGKLYDSILVIVDQLPKIIYHKLVKITINIPGLANVIRDKLVKHYGLADFIVPNKNFLFTSKFWLSFYYFFVIRCRLYTAFYPETNYQTKQQNNKKRAYF